MTAPAPAAPRSLAELLEEEDLGTPAPAIAPPAPPRSPAATPQRHQRAAAIPPPAASRPTDWSLPPPSLAEAISEPGDEEGAAALAPLEDGDLSHWDMKLSEMPRERSPDFERSAAPLPPLPSERSEPRPPPRRDELLAGDPSDLPTVDIDVGPMEVELHRAPDWRRILAWILDAVPFLALFALVLRYALDRLPHPAADLLGYVDLAVAEARDITGPIFASIVFLYAVYHALSHGLSGATLGKRLVGLRVVCRDGRRPGMIRAVLRALLAGVSLALVGVGVLLALFTRSGRGLHDFLVRTWVVKAP